VLTGKTDLLFERSEKKKETETEFLKVKRETDS
jgi:hypothetical protein